MFNYFGYGSNMDITSMNAKGVYPHSSERATLRGWQLLFNVRHFFRHEGGMGNIRLSDSPDDEVRGVLHLCPDESLSALDAVEAYGFGYDRIEISVENNGCITKAITYVGIPSFLDERCLPTDRYMNILVKGAKESGLDKAYINKLQQCPRYKKKQYPLFELPHRPAQTFRAESLINHPAYTSVSGCVFDMAEARWEHEYLKGLFGGRDMTLFHLKRLDTSDGSETLDDIKHGRLTDKQREYLNEYLHEYNAEYSFVGRFKY